jgi:hypothetical protein
MPEALKKPRTVFGLSVALLLAFTAAYIAMFAVPQREALAQGVPAPLTPLECEALLIHAGLDPDRMACAGVTSLNAATVASNAIASVQTNLTDLRGGFSDVSQYRQQIDDLESLITSGKGDQEDVNALATARANLATAQAALNTSLDTVFDDATVSLTTEKAALSDLRGDPVVNLPHPYRFADYSQSQEVVLRDALHQERISADLGEALDQANATVITTAKAVPAVTVALANHTTLASSVKNAWDSAMAQVGQE